MKQNKYILSCVCLVENALNLLLRFTPGLEKIPPLGIQPGPVLNLEHPEDASAKDNITAMYPKEDTCADELTIPVIERNDVFMTIF